MNSVGNQWFWSDITNLSKNHNIAVNNQSTLAARNISKDHTLYMRVIVKTPSYMFSIFSTFFPKTEFL